MSPVFLTICLVMLAGVIAVVAAPFWRQDRATFDPMSRDAADDQERADVSVERDVLRQSLRELDVELAQGRLEREDYERLQATDERRLLGALDRLDALGAPGHRPSTAASASAQGSHTGRARGTAVVAGLMVAVLSVGIYGFLQWRTITRLVDVQAGMAAQAPNPRAMVARLEARLKKNPDDVDGQTMAGRSYMALNRVDDAKRAYEKVLTLDARNHEAHYRLGVIMIEERAYDDPEMFRSAIKHFDVVLRDVPDQPGVNWYKGLSLWYLKRYRETEESWATAYNNLTPGSTDAAFIKQALAKLREGETPF